jgi:hypothetical protein
MSRSGFLSAAQLHDRPRGRLLQEPRLLLYFVHLPVLRSVCLAEEGAARQGGMLLESLCSVVLLLVDRPLAVPVPQAIWPSIAAVKGTFLAAASKRVALGRRTALTAASASRSVHAFSLKTQRVSRLKDAYSSLRAAVVGVLVS